MWIYPRYYILNAWTNIYNISHAFHASLTAYFVNPSHQSSCLIVSPWLASVSLHSLLGNGSVNECLQQCMNSWQRVSVGLCIPSLLGNYSAKTLKIFCCCCNPILFAIVYIHSANWCEDWVLRLGEGHSVVPFRGC
jgi:hypothetical protein